MSSVRQRAGNVEVGVNVDGAAAGMPVGVGVDVAPGWGSEESGGFGWSDDFVFAFRVRRVKVSRAGEVSRLEEYTRGAMYEDGVKGARKTEVAVKGEEEDEGVGLSELGFERDVASGVSGIGDEEVVWVA